MVYEVTIDRLLKANDRVAGYIDRNILNWTNDEVLEVVKTKAFSKGLSVFAVNAIKVEKRGFMACAIIWDLKTEDGAPLAKFLEDGTDEHDIEARFAQYLAFIGRDGNTVFRKKVKHPGTAAMNIFKDSKIEAQTRMKILIIKNVNQFLDSTRIQ
jgi:hypothetical protein